MTERLRRWQEDWWAAYFGPDWRHELRYCLRAGAVAAAILYVIMAAVSGLLDEVGRLMK